MAFDIDSQVCLTQNGFGGFGKILRILEQTEKDGFASDLAVQFGNFINRIKVAFKGRLILHVTEFEFATG